MQALVQELITVIGKFLDVKSLTQFHSCSAISLSGNKETYTMYKKLYDDGIEASENRVDNEWGLTIVARVPWSYRYYKYRIAEARLQLVNKMKLKGVFVNVPPKFALEADQLWVSCVHRGP